MTYQILPFAENLRRARDAKAWSQRELSAKAGMTQAHISRIERGDVDLRLSTLLELARLLDLEPVLVPRNALTAVEALVREAQENSEFRTARAAATTLNGIVRQLRTDYPKDGLVDDLAVLAQELHGMTALVHRRRAMDDLAKIVDDLQAGVRAGRSPTKLLRDLNRLRTLRNELAHDRPEAERPAYSLDDED